MKRVFRVTRIYPLGAYKNVQYENTLEVEGEELEELLNKYNGPVGVFENLTTEIYQAFFKHVDMALSFEAAPTIDAKREAFEEYLNNKGE